MRSPMHQAPNNRRPIRVPSRDFICCFSQQLASAFRPLPPLPLSISSTSSPTVSRAPCTPQNPPSPPAPRACKLVLLPACDLLSRPRLSCVTWFSSKAFNSPSTWILSAASTTSGISPSIPLRSRRLLRMISSLCSRSSFPLATFSSSTLPMV